MMIGYMRVSSVDDRQSTDLQRDALLAAGVDDRRLHADRASGATDGRPELKACMAELKAGHTLAVWKLDRLGLLLPHLLSIVGDLKERGEALRSLTEAMDATSLRGSSAFGALAQYVRALIRERVNAGLRAAAAWGQRGGRPRSSSEEKLVAIRDSLAGGMSKAAARNALLVKRTTLIESLKRVG